MILSKIKSMFQYNRELYENIFEDEENKIGRLLNSVLDFCVLISVFLIIIETTKPYSEIFKLEIFFTTFSISTLFMLDYVYRYFRARNKKEFLNSWLNFIDLLSFLPFFLSIVFSSIFSWEFLVILRITRVFRILRLLRNIPITVGFVKALKIYKDEYKAVLLLFGIIIFVFSVLVYEIESPVNPDFSSVGTALWWGVVTAATVGYGDIVLITPLGRIVGSIVIFLGPALLSIIGAITILVFSDVAKTQEKLRRQKIKICEKCWSENLDESNFCSNCGKKFKIIKNKQIKQTLEDKILTK